MAGKVWVQSLVTGAQTCILCCSSEGCYPQKGRRMAMAAPGSAVAVQRTPAKPALLFPLSNHNKLSHLRSNNLAGIWVVDAGHFSLSVRFLSKSWLCCSRLTFGHSVKHSSFDIIVRMMHTQPSRFHRTSMDRIPGCSTPTHVSKVSWYRYVCLCFPMHMCWGH